MKRTDGLPPANKGKSHETHVDEDILYEIIYCSHCQKRTRHIYCELEVYSGNGYACFKCGDERAPVTRMRTPKKRINRDPKRRKKAG
jgi:hypothetical protein